LSAHFALLESEQLLHIIGPDTLSFLQGQVTCDTREVSSQQAVVGAYCNPQGRMVCDFMLAELGESHYALRLKANTLATAAKTFSKYIVFSKADLEAERQDWQVIGCWGNEAAKDLAKAGFAIPEAKYQAATGDGYVVVQMDDAGTQFELLIDTQNHSERLNSLGQNLNSGKESQWQALQIRAGIGRIEQANIEELLPQMLNYDVTGHVSFTKGCYTGQEIVARLHYRGKAKRRLYLGQFDETESPGAGAALFSNAAEQSVGVLVNAASADGSNICLLCATEKGVEQGLRLTSQQGAEIQVLELPYDIPAAD
jgi:folate-binding protein YgfZ